ncbi:MAG: acetyl-CoA C-acyltransferase [Candidatus Lokiarchaeota archaeon]|nr:acetyl-CoA C-acyltransferase [Candidatus Lokiarchaeota archaeon]MBD3199729.1 acetyl-CoA C-acyltransferase [Candidatus Lokiarchaeota archaeon]
MPEPISMYDKYFKDPKREPVLIDYIRTPIGKKRGTIVRHRGDDLVVHCYRTLMERNDIDPAIIGDSIVACNSQIGDCALDIGRTSALAAHLPVSVPGMSINRQCASGAQSVMLGWQAIASGVLDCVICGGVEVQNRYAIMSDTYIFDEDKGRPIMVPPNKKITEHPEVIESAEKHNTQFAGQINAAHVMGKVWMEKAGMTKEEYRKEVDSLSLMSHQKAINHWNERGREIEPIWCPKLDEDGNPMLNEDGKIAKDLELSILTERDETPRPKTSMEKLAKLRTIVGRRKYAFLTAGNSCPTSDGAGAQLWMTRELADEYGLTPRATILNFAVVGTDPVLQLTGPIKAMPEVLKRANMSFDEMSFIEINEAFSSVIFACCYDLGLDWREDRFNPWGGAIALGHPTGCTGLRLIGTNLHQLEDSGKEFAISSMCVGLGMSTATIIKNENPK